MADWRRLVEADLRGSALVLSAFDSLVVPGPAAVCFSSCSAYLLGPTPDPEVLAGRRAPGGLSVGAKLAVQRLAARTAVAWGPRGGHVVSVSPGIIDTPQARQEAEGSAMMALLLHSTPVGRWDRAEELAEAGGLAALARDGR
jgi:NAD(P)-dependent dehydrogenase (short-subunit alcohol dehydrogenase family)